MSGLMGSSVGPQDHSVVIFLASQYGIGMDTLYSWQNYRVIFLAYELRANAVREVLCKMSLCITNLKDPHDSVNVYPTAYPFMLSASFNQMDLEDDRVQYKLKQASEVY